MKDRMPIIVVAIAAVLVVALAVRVRLRISTPPAPVGAPHVGEDSSAKGDYSSRVDERLRMLRAQHERRVAGADRNDTDDSANGPSEAAKPRQAKTGQAQAGGGPSAVQAKGEAAGGLDFPVRDSDVGESIAELEHTITTHPSREKRIEAVQALAGTGDPDAVPILIAALHDRDPQVRAEAVESLGDFPGDVDLGALQPALKDQDATVRFEALTVLGLMDTPEAVEAVKPLLDDSDADVQDLAREVQHFLEESPTPFPAVTPPRWRPARPLQHG